MRPTSAALHKRPFGQHPSRKTVTRQSAIDRMQDTATTPEKIRVLFVCLGNICRSPLAEGVFRHLAEEAGLWRTGSRSPRRGRATGTWAGAPTSGCGRRRSGAASRSREHRAQQFAAPHFDAYDHVFVMDKGNLHDVLALDAEDRYGHKVRLFREFDPEPGDFQVPDPYYGGARGFEDVHDIVERTARKLLERLAEEHGLEAEEPAA